MTPNVTPPDDFTCGGWTVQPQLGRMTRGGESVRLQPRVMDVLVYLSRSPGRVIPRAELLDALWPGEFVSDAVLNRAVCALRRVFDDDPGAPRFVETIPKRGYRLLAAVAVRGERGEEGARSPATSAPPAIGELGFGAAPLRLGPDVRGYLVWGAAEAALPLGEHVIGRGQEASLLIRHSEVSRRHARLRVTDEGTFLEDLGSTNGTFLGGLKVTGPLRLTDGDRIRLGSLELVFRDAGQRSTAPLLPAPGDSAGGGG